MSIYATWACIGDRTWEDEPRGKVLAYYGSHLYPTGHEPRATVGVCAIPGHCVPGADESADDPAPWLRLWLVPASEDDPCVVLDEDAARSLRDVLTRWINAPKTTPTANAARKDSA